MYVISIRKIENRRSGADRRKISNTIESIFKEKRGTMDRRSNGDRRDTKDRRSARYYIISDLKKEKLDKILNFKH